MVRSVEKGRKLLAPRVPTLDFLPSVKLKNKALAPTEAPVITTHKMVARAALPKTKDRRSALPIKETRAVGSADRSTISRKSVWPKPT